MFRHVGIVVNDVDRQLYFYNKLLGLEIIYSKVESGIFLDEILNNEKLNLPIYKLGKNNVTIVELLYWGKQRKYEKKISRNGITHFALTIEDVESIYLKLKKEGVKFLSKPYINLENTHKVCFCQDFEGNYIELVEEL